MQGDSRYTEEWVVVINKNKYFLTPKQTQLVKEKISQEFKGIILFDKFALNFPMIQEFYLHKRTLDPKYILQKGDDTQKGDEYQKARQKAEEIRMRFSN